MNISGVILSKFPTKQVKTKYGPKEVTDFTVKSGDGRDYKCSYWGRLESDSVNQHVSFEAEHNAKYDQYTVKGKIFDMGQPTPPTPAPAAPVLALSEAPRSEVKEEPKEAPKEREDYREAAEEAVALNLKSAQKILKKLKLEPSVSDVLSVGDMVGRTQTAILMDKKRGY